MEEQIRGKYNISQVKTLLIQNLLGDPSTKYKDVVEEENLRVKAKWKYKYLVGLRFAGFAQVLTEKQI